MVVFVTPFATNWSKCLLDFCWGEFSQELSQINEKSSKFAINRSHVNFIPHCNFKKFFSPGHHQNWLYGDVMRNGNMAAKGRQAIQSIFRALFVA